MINKFLKIVKKYKIFEERERVVVAVSGGKDSIFLYHILNQVKRILKIDILGLHVNLGINNYSNKLEEFVKEFFKKYDSDYKIVNIKKEYGFNIEDIVKNREILGFKGKSICGICSIIKRYVFLDFTRKVKYDALATAHTLEDFTRLILTLYLEGNIQPITRIYPRLDSILGIKIIKPIFFISESYIRDYLEKNKISYFKESCPYSLKKYGKIVNFIEKSEKVYKNFKEKIVFNFINLIYPTLSKEYFSKIKIKKCKICGMPTISKDGICSFCKIRNKITQHELL